MKILLVGYKGFVGRALLDKLYRDGLNANVLVLNRDLGTLKVNRLPSKQLKVLHQESNLEEAEQAELLEVTSIIYMSGVYDVSKRFLNVRPADIVDIHVDKNVSQVLGDVQWCLQKLKNLKRIVYISSQSVNRVLGLPNLGEIQLEDLVYGVNKFLAENLINHLTQAHSVSSVALRVGTVYGPGEPSHRLSRKVLESFKFNQHFVISNSNHLRNYIYVEDLAQILLHFANNDFDFSNKIVNIAGIRSFTIEEYVSELAGYWRQFTNLPTSISFEYDFTYLGEQEMLNDLDLSRVFDYSLLSDASKAIVKTFLIEQDIFHK